MTPLHLAASEGNKRVTQILVNVGAPLSAVDRQVINTPSKTNTIKY